MSDEESKLDTKNLDQLAKALKSNLKNVRIGILGGSKNVRSESDGEIKAGAKVNATSGKTKPNKPFDVSTNAAIGVLHEFGTGKMPMRSFLRMPLAENLQKYMAKAGAFNTDQLLAVIKDQSITPWLKAIAVLAESIVQDAFMTGGFGKWPAWKTPGYRNKNNRILEDTGQLRDSITSEVK